MEELSKADQQLKDLEILMNFRISDVDKFLEENEELLFNLKKKEDESRTD